MCVCVVVREGVCGCERGGEEVMGSDLYVTYTILVCLIGFSKPLVSQLMTAIPVYPPPNTPSSSHTQ